MTHRLDTGRRSPLLLATVSATAALTVTALAALAQQPLPGITIVGPNNAPAPPPPGMPGVMIAPGPQAAPPPAPPQPQQPVAQPKPKPKPKAVAAPRDPAGEGEGEGRPTGPTRIAVLVNGEPITGYEIEQRARLMALSENLQSRAQDRMKALATSSAVTERWKQIVEETVRANQGKTREQILAILQERQRTFAMGLQKQAIEGARSAVLPELRRRAREELIEEQLKLQDARSVKASPDESMVDDLVRDIAQRNKMTAAQFAAHFAKMGVDISTLKAKFRSQLAWTSAIRRQYSHLAQPSNRDIDRILQSAGPTEDQMELELQRIVVPAPAKVDQKAMAQRMAEAEGIQRQFKKCTQTAALSTRVAGARHEAMGTRRLSSFEEPTRSLLANAAQDSMLPPTITSSGIELYAVCSRRVIKAADIGRQEAQQKLMQEEMELRSRGRLRQLKENAIIESR